MPDSPAKDVEILPRRGYLEARLLGSFSAPRFKGQLEVVVRHCNEAGINRLLLDFSRLTGVPSVVDKFEIGTHGALVAGALDRIACFGTEEQTGDQFGALVARNRGLNVSVFLDRDEAVHWLLSKD